MKCKALVLTLILSVVDLSGQERDSVLVMFWNLENFFDYIDQGTGESDSEFSSMGIRHWTKKRFFRKCDSVAKSIFLIGDRYGRMPDVMGFAEVENAGVLRKLLSSTLLRKYDYEMVHHDSGDRRGIDVALLYRKSSFRKVSVSIKTPEHEGERLSTRDILHVCLEDCKGERTDFIVNHHPSKFGGAKESESRRIAAMQSLKDVCDSLAASGERRIIAMGDFNDTPDAASFGIISGTLSCKGMELHEKGEGTIRYEGKWDLIDMFMVSEEMDDLTEMEVCRIPFLMTWERKHPGEKPLRTYTGPRYAGGVSDHCPIILWYFKDND